MQYILNQKKVIYSALLCTTLTLTQSLWVILHRGQLIWTVSSWEISKSDILLLYVIEVCLASNVALRLAVWVSWSIQNASTTIRLLDLNICAYVHSLQKMNESKIYT